MGCDVVILCWAGVFVAALLYYFWRLSKFDYEVRHAVEEVKRKRKRAKLEEILGVEGLNGVASRFQTEYQQKQLSELSRKVEELTTSLKGMRSSLERTVSIDDALNTIEARLHLLEQPKTKKDKK